MNSDLGLRIAPEAAAQEAPPIEFVVLGQKIFVHEGETLAAAAAAAGILKLRESDNGSPRGAFCGMGVCSECLVPIDNGELVRACMHTARYHQLEAVGGVQAVSSGSLQEEVVERPDVLVVGGGPAGLSAARGAALSGAKVVLLDERAHLGGQYYKQVRTRRAKHLHSDAQMRAGATLIAEAEGLGITIYRDALVWGAFPPREIAALIGARAYRFEPSRLILATGAYERAVPVPGWTLPGVMTSGAAQTFVRSYRVLPGRRIVVAGNGPLNLQLAAELAASGADVLALVEAAAAPSPSMAGALFGLLRSPSLVRDALRYRAALLRAKSPILYRHVLVGVEGDGQAKRAVVAQIDDLGNIVPGTRRKFDVDVVCVGYGFQPANELARLLGCVHTYDPARGVFATVTGDDCETSVPNIFSAGDCGGMVGARASIEQGFIAGCTAAATLAKPTWPRFSSEVVASRHRLARHLAFQSSLWRVFRAPLFRHQLADDQTAICRCEHVTLKLIKGEIARGATSIGGLKRATRAGMGRCQGRYCGPILTELLAEATGQPPTDDLTFAPRPPARPVPIGMIARLHSR